MAKHLLRMRTNVGIFVLAAVYKVGTVAGTVVNGSYTISTFLSGFCTYPFGIWGDKQGDYLYFGCTSGGVYRYDLSGSSLSNIVSGISVDGSIWGNNQGAVYFSDRNGGHVYALNTASLTYAVYAGGGSGSDGVRATSAALNNPLSVFGDSSGNVYFTEVIGTSGDVRKVAVTTTVISTLLTNLYDPYGGYFDDVNNVLYACNSESLSTVVKVTNGGSGTKTTVYGAGSSTASGVPSTSAAGGHVVGPVGLFVDSIANLYITDQNKCLVRVVLASNSLIYTIAGVVGQCTESGDGGKGTDAHLNTPHNVWADSTGVVYVATWQGNTIRKLWIDTSPTTAPTFEPSVVPTTTAPSSAPSTFVPTLCPTVGPSALPTTVAPTTTIPSVLPSVSPSVIPSVGPTFAPTKCPSVNPSVNPSMQPTLVPSEEPTEQPTTAAPTLSMAPTMVPSVTPSVSPSDQPSEAPTHAPVDHSAATILGLIIGIVIVSIVALVAIVVAVFYYRKAAKLQQRVSPQSTAPNGEVIRYV